MTEENNNSPKRIVRQTFEGKFGVSDNPADHGFGRRPETPDPDAQETRSERREYERSRERKPFGDRRFGDRNRRFDRDERRPFSRERFSRDGERKPFNREGAEGENRERNSERSFGERRFGDRDRRFDRDRKRPFDRNGRRPFNRDARRGHRFDDRPDFEENRPIFRQKVETKSVEDDDIIRDEDAVLQFADSAEIAPETASANPPWFRRLLALTTEKGREREGKFIAEGVRVVEEILAKHLDLVQEVLFAGTAKTNENGEEFFEVLPGLVQTKEKVSAAGVHINVVSEDQLKRLSSTVTTQGVIAICRAASLKPDFKASHSILTLVDAVQDPGNLGAIFRTSLGFNSSGIIIGKGSVNPFNPKVVRGSSGTFLRVPFIKDVNLIDAINDLHREGYTIIATDLHGKQSLAEIKPNKLRKVAFLVGNEGAGTDQHLIDISDETVKIPMSSDLESLNVSVAHGILSYEMAKIQKDLD